MIPPDGTHDVPAGKIATVVTHLEMTELPAIPSDPGGAWTLRRVETPALDWYRDLFPRVGEEWLWISRARMSDAKLAGIIHSPLVEVYALQHEGRDEGLLELDFREAGHCEIVFFGVSARLVGSGAGRWLMNRALELAWSRPVNPARCRSGLSIRSGRARMRGSAPAREILARLFSRTSKAARLSSVS